MEDDSDFILLYIAALMTSWWFLLRSSSRPGRAPTSEHYQRLDWDRHVNLGLDCLWFKRMYRLSKPVFDELVELLTPDLAKSENMLSKLRHADIIPSHIQVAMALQYLGGGSYLTIFTLFGVSKSASYDILYRVCDAIN
ncbi:unnamed protein product [Phaeothamnion confervicola]